VILQSEASECGLACLAMVSTLHGATATLAQLRRRFPTSLRGATMHQLMGIAESLGFMPRPLRLELDDLRKLELPCILHWNLDHFVVLQRVKGNGSCVILDPAVGRRTLSRSQVSKHFTGFALELTPTGRLRADDSLEPARVDRLGKLDGLANSVAQLVGLAALLELFAAVSPLLNQLVVDEAIATQDIDLLTVILLGLAILLLIQTCLGIARSWLLMTVGQRWAFRWASRLFAHLVSLPVAFFERRHVGDVASRFESMAAIQRTLTLKAMEAVIDGAMGLIALCLMYVYSPMLASVVLASVALYAGLRAMAYRPYREAASERLVVAARERSTFLESLRAIVPLKLFGREGLRVARWQNLLVEVQNRDARTQKMAIGFTAANTFLFGLQNMFVFWYGARLVMAASVGAADHFSIGMLFAFVNYQTQFTSRVTALIDYAVEIKMLSLHKDRLADIVDTEPEPAEDHLVRDLSDLPATIELRNVSFRYGSKDPWVLREVDLNIAGGENVAIVGPSGCGKSTLLKVMLGLLEPTEGEVLFGGIPVRQLGLRAVRRQIGTVMQEDVLLSGNILENIAFFDDQIDIGRVEHCCRIASIHEDIVRMPMGYQSLVGDMGSSLSGGQRQRILLARALYKSPRVLALDEATSHLDVANEKIITQALAALELTRVVVAHRPETIAGAQRVVRMQEGRVVGLKSVAASSA
jgi:ATP-binding cassette, subfamily B, bacterial CvaB/MchF/RaxB